MNAPSPIWRHLAVAATAAGAALSLVVAAAMIQATLTRRADQPQKDPRMVAGVERLLAADAKGAPESADDGTLSRQIRQLDAEIRADYFRRQGLLNRGRWLLPVGLVLFALGAKGLVALRRAWPVPATAAGDRAESARLQATRGRWAVAAMAGATGAAIAALAVILPPEIPAPTPTPPAVMAAATAPAPAPAGEANWPAFRGSGGGGVSLARNVPVRFDMATGRGVRWHKPVPLEGHNSPIIWGKKVFLTGATEKERAVFCFDGDTGDLLWRRGVDVPAVGAKAEVFEETGWAAPTAATDGKSVAAIFGNMDLACFDLAGKPLWVFNLGAAASNYGYASSLLMTGGKVIVQIDQKEDESGASRSRLLAFEAATGKKAWETPRPTEAAWSSPILAAAPSGPQVIAIGNPWAIAYEPAGGKELWRAKVLAGDGAPSPVYAGGLVMAGNAGSGLSGIKPDGRGDVTNTHAIWKIEEGLGDVVSPVSDGKRVYLVQSDGLLRCVSVEGKSPVVVWKHEFEMPFSASPVLAGGRLYLLSVKGTLIVCEAGASFKEIARSELGENCHASLAVVDGRIYVRGAKNLYCIESPAP